MTETPAHEAPPSTPPVTPPPDAPPERRPDDFALSVYRGTQRVFSRNPLIRMALAVPRTLRFLADNLDRRLAGIEDGLPTPKLSLKLAAHVATDEAILGLAMGPNRFPRRADYLRVGAEMRAMRALFEKRGWLDDPRSYHRDPPELDDPTISEHWTVTSGRLPVIRYERLLFDSGFEPRPEEVAAERWNGFTPNRTAGAWVLRHAGPPRPWLVCIHGFGMGYPVMDFGAFEAKLVHEELGYNVLLPVLPLHGHRKITPMSGEAFLSFDLVHSVHGLTQSVWDIRRLIGWARRQGGGPIGLYGVSLGAYVAALLSTIEPDLDRVIAGVPVSDFPGLFRGHSPTHIRMRAVDHNIIGPAVEAVHRVVSPLAMPTLVPRDRRYIFAGLGDRVVRPEQAHALWQHWEQPTIAWYPGSHVGYLWADEVTALVRRALARGVTA